MTNRFVIDDEGYIVDTTSNKRLNTVGVIDTLNEMNSFLSPFNEDWNSDEDKHWDTINEEMPTRTINNIDVSGRKMWELWEKEMFPTIPTYWLWVNKAIEFITIGCIIGFILLMAYAIFK